MSAEPCIASIAPNALGITLGCRCCRNSFFNNFIMRRFQDRAFVRNFIFCGIIRETLSALCAAPIGFISVLRTGSLLALEGNKLVVASLGRRLKLNTITAGDIAPDIHGIGRVYKPVVINIGGGLVYRNIVAAGNEATEENNVCRVDYAVAVQVAGDIINYLNRSVIDTDSDSIHIVVDDRAAVIGEANVHEIAVLCGVLDMECENCYLTVLDILLGDVLRIPRKLTAAAKILRRCKGHIIERVPFFDRRKFCLVLIIFELERHSQDARVVLDYQADLNIAVLHGVCAINRNNGSGSCFGSTEGQHAERQNGDYHRYCHKQ